MTWTLAGAIAFGALIGWYTYYINRYRRGDVQFSDLVTLIGILGGGTILSLYEKGTDAFGAYAVGLFLGFFAYLGFLAICVYRSPDFDVSWFLDGRRKNPPADYGFGHDRGSGTGLGTGGKID